MANNDETLSTTKEIINYITRVNNIHVWETVAKNEEVRKYINNHYGNDDVIKFLTMMPAKVAYNFALNGPTSLEVWRIFEKKVEFLNCLN